ncbi:hypothetical protein C0J52_27654 [Blattella germanica]|nr:hypothetical protein C0J52_27654 [Blattella germanica]
MYRNRTSSGRRFPRQPAIGRAAPIQRSASQRQHGHRADPTVADGYLAASAPLPACLPATERTRTQPASAELQCTPPCLPARHTASRRPDDFS